LIKYLSEHNKKDKLTKTLELLERPVLKYLIVNYSYASVELIKNLLVNGHEITLLESNQFYVDVLKNNKVINELLTVHKGKLTIKSYGFDLLNDECKKCDVLVYTTTTPGGIAHTRITYDMIVSVKKNGVFVDLSAENGLCCEAINYPNDKRYPYTMVKNTVCLALNNIPSKFYPKDASDFTCDFILNLLKHFEDNTLDTIKSDYAIKNSMQTFGGNIVSKTIGESLNLKYKEI
jgi:alanine dehydrogenase